LKNKFIIAFLLLAFLFSFMQVFGASVMPQLFQGNDSNPNDYTPPSGCIHYEIPNSGTPGTYTVKFNSSGQVDPSGNCSFTVTVGKQSGQSYTKVLSWSSNFPIYAVIVKGGNAFNLYQYPNTTREDTDLVSPNNASGKPADVSHVSIVICSGSCSSSNSSSTSSVCPPTPCDNSGIFLVFLIISFFLIGLIGGLLYCCCYKKHHNRCE